MGRMTFVSTEFLYRNNQYKLSLCGRFQVYNAVLALEVIDMLRRKGFNISEEAVIKGLRSLKIPAKFEVVSISPLIIADSTHTPIAIETVCDSLADFREITGSKIRLCLPGGEIVADYIRVLEKRGYEIESIILSEDVTTSPLPPNTTICKTPKAIVKTALCGLTNDTVLLISGDHPFVMPVRYQLLSTLCF